MTSHKKRHGDGPGSRISRELEDASSRDSGDSDDNDSMSDVKVEEEIVENANVNRMNPTGPEQDDHIETRENTFQENLYVYKKSCNYWTGLFMLFTLSLSQLSIIGNQLKMYYIH